MLIDDEPLARQKLRNMLDAENGVQICAEAGNLRDTIRLIEKEKPDALLLDVRMPGGDGFEVLNQLKIKPLVVFVSAYADYAIRAFDFAAVDYLLKPVRTERLREALQRLQNALQPEITTSDLLPAYKENDRICLRTPERTVVSLFDQIIYLEADGDFTRFWIEGEPPLMICQTLGVYDRTLPSPPFIRLDRSLMINLGRVTGMEISPTRGASVSLEGLPAPLKLGKSALRRLRAALG
jgi:two-component system, LytTR family, response regulator